MVNIFRGWSFLQGLINFRKYISIVANPPKHIRLFVTGSSVVDCLYQLEKKAGLPVGDLSISGKPTKVVAWPALQHGSNHVVTSKTSDDWRKNNSGYIAGHVFEADNFFHFHATLHISKNCPGVYRDGVCINCGDVSN